MMNKRGAAAATLTGILVGSTLLAPQASAQQLGVMPNISGQILQRAVSMINAATGENDLSVATYNLTATGQEVISQTNWVVCWQAPKPGKPVDESTWIGVGVRRPNTACYS